jgi:serine/threonine protein kinase
MDERSAHPKIEPVKNNNGDSNERQGVSSGVNMAMPKGMVTGALLDGKYAIGRVMGSGAFGLVFEGKNLELDEKVAIKALRPEIAVDNAMVGRFAREAKSAASIRSEYVCSVYDVGTSRDGVPYIVMEYLEGRDLGTILNDDGPFSPRTAVEYALQMCEALAVAHAKGIVHRDIKPENLMITERAGGMRILKVLDFGISKAALTGSIFGGELPIVKTLNLIGTPLYMSPEQVRSSSGVDVRSDIWSVGMVLYEILAGTTAFEGASITEICASILEMKPTPIELHRNDLPAGLVDAIKKCLEKDVKDRYQNVAELALALMPFGPKRSRLNVERAITILQSVGQVDKSVQLDSAPPPSNEISQQIQIPRASAVSNISLGIITPKTGATRSGPPTIDETKKNDGGGGGVSTSNLTKKRRLLAAAGIVVIAGALAAVFFSGVLKSKAATTTAVGAPAPTSPATETATAASTVPVIAGTTTTTTPAPSETVKSGAAVTPPTPTTTPAVLYTPGRPGAGAPLSRPGAGAGAGGHATSSAASTTNAPSASTPPAAAATTQQPPASDPNKGRTFRREL